MPDKSTFPLTIINKMKEVAEDETLDCETVTNIFLVCGGNDIENVRNVAKVKEDYKKLLVYATEAFPKATINAVSLLPRRSKYRKHIDDMYEMNDWLKSHCRSCGARFVDIFHFFVDKLNGNMNFKLINNYDKLHLTKVGDSVLGKVLIAVANRPRS